MSVWDGMANGRDGSSVSIDYTWAAPVFFLSTMLGFAKTTSEDNAKKWAWRLLVLVKGLIKSLRATGFKPERVQRVISSAPAIAEATVEWIRLESSPDAESGKSPDLILFHEIAEVCAKSSLSPNWCLKTLQ